MNRTTEDSYEPEREEGEGKEFSEGRGGVEIQREAQMQRPMKHYRNMSNVEEVSPPPSHFRNTSGSAETDPYKTDNKDVEKTITSSFLKNKEKYESGYKENEEERQERQPVERNNNYNGNRNAESYAENNDNNYNREPKDVSYTGNKYNNGERIEEYCEPGDKKCMLRRGQLSQKRPTLLTKNPPSLLHGGFLVRRVGRFCESCPLLSIHFLSPGSQYSSILSPLLYLFPVYDTSFGSLL
jgi:hypothetical protein